MKILKKIGAIFLMVTFVVGVLPVTASAASIPTQVIDGLTTLYSMSYDFTNRPWDSSSGISIITLDCDFHYPGQMGHESLSPTVVVQVSNSNGDSNSGNWGYTSIYNAGERLSLYPIVSFFDSDLSTGQIQNTPIYPVNNKINITIYSGFLAEDAGDSTVYYISSPTTFEIDVEKNPSGKIVNTPESSGGGEPVNPEPSTEFPTMDEDNARAFLGFIYNDSKFKTADLSNFPDYLLLTGQYRGSEQELAIKAQVFLNMVQASIDRYIEGSNVCKEYLLSSLQSQLEDSLSGYSQDKFEDCFSDSVKWLGSHLTSYTDWIDDFGSLLIAAGKIADTWSAMEFIVENSPSVIQGILLPLEAELSGRYTYFNEYLRNRDTFGEKDDPAFETIMEFVAFALRENNWYGGFISWIPGVASWYESREMIDDWAEYTYQLYIYAQNEKQSASFTNNYSIIQVQCPVDVQIFDKQSTKVAETSQNEIIHPVPENLQTELMLYVLGDMKLIIVSDPNKYDLRLIASEDGKFNYIYSKIDENGQETIRYNTYEIPIQAQDVFISQSNLTGISSVNPDTESVVPIQSTLVENGNSVAISVSSNQEIEIVGTKNYIPGDLVRLEAPPITDFAFVGWMENGISISDSPIYEFTAIENRTLSAIYQDLDEENPPAEGDSNDESSDSSSIYTITFDTQIPGETRIPVETDENGRLSELPTPPFWYGHEFTGWYTAPVDGMEVTLDNVFTDDTIVYAHWTEISASMPEPEPEPNPEPTPEPDSKPNSGESSSGSSAPATYRPTIMDTENGEVTVSPIRPERGDTVIITPEPEDGCEVAEVIITAQNGDGVEVTQNEDGTWSFVQPAGTVKIQVTFREIPPSPVILPFVDVSLRAWYYDAVEYVYREGMMAATSNEQFSPDITTSRAMLATILYRLDGQPVVGTPSFSDVPTGQWYTSPAVWAADSGIAGGYGNGIFGPNDPVTREQMAVMLYRYAQYKGYDTTISSNNDLEQYSDANLVSAWAQTAMLWAYQNGLITGSSATTLDPLDDASRAEVATTLMKFMKNIVQYP